MLLKYVLYVNSRIYQDLLKSDFFFSMLFVVVILCA